jgi:hypothetical protein
MTDKGIVNPYKIKVRKHRQYLDKQVRRHDYLDEKFKNRNDNSYANKSQAFEDALDNLNNIFGDEE